METNRIVIKIENSNFCSKSVPIFILYRLKDLSPFVPEDEHDDVIESIKFDMLALVPEDEVIQPEISISTANNVCKC